VIAVKGRPRSPSTLLDSDASCTREANKHLRGIPGGQLEQVKAAARQDAQTCEFRIVEPTRPNPTRHQGTLLSPRGTRLIFTVLCQLAAQDSTAQAACEMASRGFRSEQGAEGAGTAERDRAEALLKQVATARAQLRTLHDAVLKYRKAHNRACPVDLESLAKVGLIPEVPLDPWDQPFHFRCPRPDAENEWDLSSNGPDQTNGTVDDILLDEK
jgi:hypothetical protein